MTPPSDPREPTPRPDLWAGSDGWLELQPLMAERRGDRLVVDCVVRVGHPGPGAPIDGQPVALALDCSADADDTTAEAVLDLISHDATMHLLRDDDGVLMVLIAGTHAVIFEVAVR